MNKAQKALCTLLFSGLIFHSEGHAQHTLEAQLDTLQNITEINMVQEASEIVFSDPVVFEDEELLIGQIASVTVDSRGRVYIADRDQHTIHRFDEEGSYLESFGREGEGPGEFRNLIEVDYRDGTMYTLDQNLNRIIGFDSESLDVVYERSLAGTTNRQGMEVRSMPGAFFVLPEQRFMLAFDAFSDINRPGAFYIPVDIMDSSGAYAGINSIRLPARESVMIPSGDGNIGVVVPPYGRRSLLASDSHGNIYASWTNHLLIKQFDRHGTFHQAWFADEPGPELSYRQIRDHYSDGLVSALQSQSLPDHWPALRSFLADDQQNLWIERFTGEPGRSEWIVVNSEGDVTARMSLPSAQSVYHIANGHIYLTERDEFGLDVVMRYRVSFE